MAERQTGYWRKWLLEFLSIVTGILLALWVDDWNQDRLGRKQGREGLVQIRQEIQGNKQQIEKKLPRLQAIQTWLKRYQAGETKTLTRIITEMNAELGHGFDMPLLQHAAWDSARSTGLVKHIDYDIVRNLSQMSSLERLVDKRTDHLLSLVYNPAMTDATQTEGLLATGRLLGGDSINSLKSLLLIYDRNLAEIETELD